MNESAAPPPDSPRKVGFFVTAVAAACGLTYGFYAGDASVTSVAGKAGYFLPEALIGWVILYLASLKDLPNPFKLVPFLALYVSLIAGSFVSDSSTFSALGQARDSLGEEIAGVMDQSIEANETGAEIDYTPGPNVMAGDMGKVESFAKEHMAAMVELRNRYMAAIQAIGFFDLLAPKRLAADEGLRESEFLLERARAAAREYLQAYHARIEEVPGRIEAMDVSDHFRDQLNAGFARGANEARDDIEKVFALEFEVLDTAEGIIDLLRENRDQWIVKDGQILFGDEDLLNRYNSEFARMNSQFEEQQNIQRALADQTRSVFDIGG